MVCWYAEVYSLCWSKCVFLLYVLCVGMGLTNCYNSYLRPQNCRDEVAAADITNARNTKCWVGKILCSKLAFGWLINQHFEIRINLEDAFSLHGFYVWDCKTVFAVNCNAKIVILLHDVSLDESIRVEVIVNLWVDYWVLWHSNWTCFYKEG